jgi:hypothetical protein
MDAEATDADGRAARAAFWTFLGMAIAFKVVTSIVIFAMQPSWWSVWFLLGMNWYWLVIPLVGLAFPAMFWYRLMRVRARRRELMRSEWSVGPSSDWKSAPVRGTMGEW